MRQNTIIFFFKLALIFLYLYALDLLALGLKFFSQFFFFGGEAAGHYTLQCSELKRTKWDSAAFKENALSPAVQFLQLLKLELIFFFLSVESRTQDDLPSKRPPGR